MQNSTLMVKVQAKKTCTTQCNLQKDKLTSTRFVVYPNTTLSSFTNTLHAIYPFINAHIKKQIGILDGQFNLLTHYTKFSENYR